VPHRFPSDRLFSKPAQTLLLLLSMMGALLGASSVAAAHCHQPSPATDYVTGQIQAPAATPALLQSPVALLDNSIGAAAPALEPDCCQQRCSCPMAACGAGHGAASPAPVLAFTSGGAEAIPTASNLYTHLHIALLLKPPIAA